MPKYLRQEIRNKLARYLADEISLRTFQEWLVPATWDIATPGDTIAQDLVYEIELRLAEYTNRHRTKKELRKVLLPLTGTM